MRELITRGLDHDPLFRWRGQAVTRIENLSDIVFALALGMLVSASTPPRTFSALLDTLITIVPVAAGFAILLVLWNAHFTFFRRYGVADGRIIFLNAVLLLLILFIAYPLRFCFESFFGFVIASATGDWSRLIAAGIFEAEATYIMAIFGTGYGVVHVLFALMYAHVLNRRDLLDLSPSELAISRRSFWIHWVEVLCSLGVLVFALFTPVGPFAGFVLFFTWPLIWLVQWRIPIPKSDADEPGQEP